MSAKEKIDFDAVSVGPELDALVMEHFLGWKPRHPDRLHPNGGWWLPNGKIHVGLSPVSTQINVCMLLVEEEIERRGLGGRYAYHLMLEVGESIESLFLSGGSIDSLFCVITATPEQRCRAALRVVMA